MKWSAPTASLHRCAIAGRAPVVPEVAGDGVGVVLGAHGAEVVVPSHRGPVLHGLQPHCGNVAARVATGQDDLQTTLEGGADDLDLARDARCEELHRDHDRPRGRVDGVDQRAPRTGRIERRLVWPAVRDQVLHCGDWSRQRSPAKEMPWCASSSPLLPGTFWMKLVPDFIEPMWRTTHSATPDSFLDAVGIVQPAPVGR
ncbi:hypothetical protein [Nocardioides sp. B-3]|uniref:hypothetical protein n=1 Tax=Nocardioides sp. B-3 TaxID=2895565 RepID=UPI0021538D6D|nr:hypothetical protein [Nocardioides sp. B-3]UUZ58139.1 hypothetical protein LP418_17925 [Nocardioides sp. B-3]